MARVRLRSAMCRAIVWLANGTDGDTKTDEFSEKFQKGGGVISNPKIYMDI